jgi:hypothetical protein
VLLRVLEYYQGILILTTNRIRDIDIAVQSRIHLALKFTELDVRHTKKVWDIYLDQLNSQNTVDKEAIQDWAYKKAETFLRGAPENLNGRQIRNIVSSAQAMARGDGRRLDLDDIKKVYNTTIDFQTSLWDMNDKVRERAEVEFRKARRRRDDDY